MVKTLPVEEYTTVYVKYETVTLTDTYSTYGKTFKILKTLIKRKKCETSFFKRL